MVCVTVKIGEGAFTHRGRIAVPSIERALKIVKAGKAGRRMRLVFPIDPEAFFASGGLRSEGGGLRRGMRALSARMERSLLRRRTM